MSPTAPFRRVARAVAVSLLLGVSLALAAVAYDVPPAAANHSHFRYGHIFWSPADGTTIEFSLQNAFRRDGYSCIRPATATTLEAVPCTGPDGLAGVSDVIQETIGGTVLETGDGTVIGGPNGGPLLYLVTSINPEENSLFGLALDPASMPALDTTISHTYAQPGNYVAFTDSCCRFAHVNNSGAPYRVETLVNVGTGNSSPRSALPPVVRCPINAVCTFRVPAADPDGDPVRFRLSGPAESGGIVQPGPPHAPNAATIDPVTGEYRWDTTGAQVDSSGPTYYSTQVAIEDIDAAGNMKSKVALDFLIQLIPFVGVDPEFVQPPTPACGSTLQTTPGSPLTFDVEAADADKDQTVTLNAAGLPGGASMTPVLPTTDNPVRSTFSWTPTAADVGTRVVTFTATDSSGRQVLCSVTIEVKRTILIHAGEGDEGESIPVEAEIDSSDPVTVLWSAVPGPGVDPGATCTFSDSPQAFPFGALSRIPGAEFFGFLFPGSGVSQPEPSGRKVYMTCTDDGPFLVTATDTTGGGPPLSGTTTVFVRNVAPDALIETPAPDTRVGVGQTVRVRALLFDPGTNDTHTCQIEWGDGTTSEGTVTETGGAGLCEGSHTYEARGEYIIRVHVRDDDMPGGPRAGVSATALANVDTNDDSPAPTTPSPAFGFLGGGFPEFRGIPPQFISQR